MIDIRSTEGKLLLRYDPNQNLIEIQRHNIKTTIDLNQYKRSAMQSDDDLRKIIETIFSYRLKNGNAIQRPQGFTVDDCIYLARKLSLPAFSQEEQSGPTATEQGGDDGHRSND